MARLTTPGAANTKTAKHADDFRIRNLILHLAPHTNAGILTASGKLLNLCPMASAGCATACLFTAGRAGSFASINQARIRKTRQFAADRAAFVAQLVDEIAALERAATKRGEVAAVRLNGTSDVMWESIPCERDGAAYPSLMAAFPMVQFYDYTKVITRLRRALPSNYHLTFSLAESNDAHAAEALERGFNVAAVLRVAKGQPLPATWCGRPVIDGDEHDFRFRDPKGGCIVALRPKGRAIADRSGFVRDIDATLDSTKAPTFAA